MKDIKIDLKLSYLKPKNAAWIVSAFQQIKPETLIRGWSKAGIKESVLKCRN